MSILFFKIDINKLALHKYEVNKFITQYRYTMSN